MTNFEKWKQGLTEEKALGFFKPNSNCEACPCNDECGDCDNEYWTCEYFFKQWANSPAEESEPAPLTSTIVWHKYPEEKPPHAVEYLVVGRGEKESETLYYDANDWFCVGITHWAELPEPPKEVK